MSDMEIITDRPGGRVLGGKISGPGYSITVRPDAPPVIEYDRGKCRLVPIPANGDGEQVERFTILERK